MIIPPIATGMTAVVWSPSSSSAHVYPKRFARGCSALESLGYRISIASSAQGNTLASYLDAESLAKEAHEAAADDTVGLVVATSGGWTSTSLLPHLDFELLARHPKAFVGYSDLTALLNVITQRTGLVTYLGPMILLEFGEHGGTWPFTANSFRRTIAAREGDYWQLEYSDVWTDELLPWDENDSRVRRGASHDDSPRTLRAGEGEGVLWGGSIRTLSLLAGTEYWPCPARQSVLALEDEGMSPDELFAHLTTLKRAHAFDRCAAVVFGRFSRPRPNTAGFRDLDAVIKHTLPFNLVIVAGVDFGHTEPKNTLPLGATLRVDATQTPAQITVHMN